MADRGGLENRCAFAGTVGSNPTLSANPSFASSRFRSRAHQKPEEIASTLRQVEVLSCQGKPIVDAVRTIGVTEATHIAGVPGMADSS